MNNGERTHADGRPPIMLTALDRNRLLALLSDAPATLDSGVARFLGEEIARAEIAPDDVAANSVVRMGCEVKFIDHAATRIRCAELVFPEDARSSHCISILSPTGTALIGLGPGQSIRWTEQGRARSLAVLEVRARVEPSLPWSQHDPFILSWRPRELELRSRARQRHDREGACQGYRLQRIYSSRDSGQSTVRDQE